MLIEGQIESTERQLHLAAQANARFFHLSRQLVAPVRDGDRFRSSPVDDSLRHALRIDLDRERLLPNHGDPDIASLLNLLLDDARCECETLETVDVPR